MTKSKKQNDSDLADQFKDGEVLDTKQNDQEEIKPNFNWKGNSEFRHDLFKLELSNMLKNTSYKEGDPIIRNVEHVHFYHSKDSKGKEQTYSQPVGGHFHKVDMVMTVNGEITAKCGPPFHYIRKKVRPGKFKKALSRIFYLDNRKDDDIHDDHTHKINYIHSEVLTEKKIKAIREANVNNLDMVTSRVVTPPPVEKEQVTDVQT